MAAGVRGICASLTDHASADWCFGDPDGRSGVAARLVAPRVHFRPCSDMASSIEHESPPARPRSPGRWVRLVAVLHRWAESGWAGPATGVWTFLQSSVVIGPADLLLVPLGLSDPRRVYRLALWSVAGATLGAIVAFALGALAFESVQPLLGWMGVGPEELERSRELFDEHGWLFVALSTVTPISTKLVCIAAGAFGVPFPHFVVAVFLGRATRFLVIATLVRFAGERLVRILERRTGRSIEELGPTNWGRTRSRG